MKEFLCSECHLRPGAILFVQEHVPVIDFFTRKVVGDYHRVEYRLCPSCERELSSRLGRPAA
jgi:hypothetical protein